MLTHELFSDNGRSVTQICTLSFGDGQTVTGQICAQSRYDDCVVDYSGAVERLPFIFDTADSVLLRAFFQTFARELGARFREETVGEWPNLIPSEAAVAGDLMNHHG